MATTERRRAPRVSFYCEAQLEGIDMGKTHVRVSDLSRLGAFVDARTVLPAGATARLRFMLDSREVEVSVEVRYSMAGFGMGVRFLDLADEDRERIEAVVARQA